jgi:predicted DNA-binding transcriptional regulator YafY
MASAEQMVRVIALWRALATAGTRGLVLSRFAEQRGWPPRYIQRDLKTLESAGFPIEGGRGRYRLPADWAPRIQIDADPEELFALFVARQLAGPLRGTLSGRALDRLWAKLSAEARQPALLPDGDNSIVVRAPGAIDYAPHRVRIAAIERAIAERKALRCRYRRPRTGEITDRVIEPGELYIDPGLEAMYCIAWCRRRAAVRVFAVHRFLDIEPTGEPAPPRPETRSRVALRKAFRVWRSDTAERVRLHFRPEVASEIAERRWHSTQELEPTVEGGLLLTMEVADPAELERWLLGFGPDVLVLEPRWLAEQIRERHRQAANTRTGAARTALRPTGPRQSARRRDTR